MSSRCIVITGVSRGLGRALAEKFAAMEHRVFGCARSRDALLDLSRDLGPGHPLEVVDVEDEAAVHSWAGRVLEQGGPPDILINNAALMNRPAPLWKVSAEDFNRLIDINIKGVANVLRAFLPAMTERASGVIINISSEWGRSTSPRVGPYCTTKFAIEGLTRALAQELPKGMAAIPLSPGIIDTDMLRTCFGSSAAKYHGPEKWVETAAPFILDLGPTHNGKSLTIPTP